MKHDHRTNPEQDPNINRTGSILQHFYIVFSSIKKKSSSKKIKKNELKDIKKKLHFKILLYILSSFCYIILLFIFLKAFFCAFLFLFWHFTHPRRPPTYRQVYRSVSGGGCWCTARYRKINRLWKTPPITPVKFFKKNLK